jgi:hypothetical protein
MKRTLKVAVGDLVQIKVSTRILVGLVMATEASWYVINNHVDVCNHIVPVTSVVKIIKKGAVPKRYRKYLV